jgi:hypothetical protein
MSAEPQLSAPAEPLGTAMCGGSATGRLGAQEVIAAIGEHPFVTHQGQFLGAAIRDPFRKSR